VCPYARADPGDVMVCAPGVVRRVTDRSP